MRTLVMIAAVSMICGSAVAGDGEWKVTVLLESDRGMGGAAVGDLDPTQAGDEIAVVNGAGEVWMAGCGSSGWDSQRIHKGDGEMIMCAIGDVDPRHEGEEFVGVGMVSGPESRVGPGQVLMVRKGPHGWHSEQVFVDDHMIHGVAIGDVAERHAGNEIIACGFNHRVTLIWFEGSAWKHEVIYVANDRMKIAAIADVVAEHEGLEVVVSGSDGRVVALWEGPLGWQHETVYSDRVGQSRVACGEPGVLIGGDGGKVTLARRDGACWHTDCLYRDHAKIRGVAIADVDGGVPGVELYACGYSQRVTQLVQNENGYWISEVIFTDERPLHHLVAGDVDPAHTGPELVTCGHGGRLILLTPNP